MCCMTVGERIRRAREAAGLKQSELAKKAGVTPSAISQIESGLSKQPSADNLLKIAKALNANPQWIISGRGDKRQLSVIQQRISDAMARLGLYPADIDMLTGGAVSAQTAQRWLDGQSEPTAEELRRVAPHLGMPPDYFSAGAQVASTNSDAGLSPDEQALIEAYRRTDANGRAAIRSLCEAVSMPSPIDRRLADLRRLAEEALAKHEARSETTLSTSEREQYIYDHIAFRLREEPVKSTRETKDGGENNGSNH